MTKPFDVLVIGSGPAGYIGAIRAAQFGLRTAVVERDRMGGICLNWGCIPTKAMLKGAEFAESLRHAGTFGFSIDHSTFDISSLVKHSRRVADQLSGGIDYLMKKNDVQVIRGEARLQSEGQVVVGSDNSETVYQAEYIIIATGARPRDLPGIELDKKRVWTYFEAMVPDALPNRLLVIGSGAIGTEFASLYSDLGTDVTLVEMAPSILPVEDKEVSDAVAKSFTRRGMDVRVQSKVTSIDKSKDPMVCTVEASDGSNERIEADKVLVSVGVRGNIEGLGLEQLGITSSNSFIEVDAFGFTGVAGIYAVGDVTGGPCLAHKASHEAVVCVEKIVGASHIRPLDREKVPGCTYCRPQVASLGMTEHQAKNDGYKVRVGRFNYQANGKALAINEPEGFVKTVFDERSGELLGAHMVGNDVTEQIQGYGIAQALEATDAELAHTIFAHPTLSEAMHESVLDSLGRALNQ